MAELGNMLRVLRGQQSQLHVAEATGLSLRTIQRAEDGHDVRLDTVRALAKHHKLKPAEYSQLLVAYVIQHLGEDAQHIIVRSALGKVTPLTTTEQFMARFKKIPTKFQEQLMLAAERDEVLRSIAPLNQLYDNLKKSQTLSDSDPEPK